MKITEIAQRLRKAQTEVEVAKRKKIELSEQCKQIRKDLKKYNIDVGPKYDLKKLQVGIKVIEDSMAKSEKEIMEMLDDIESRINKNKN